MAVDLTSFDYALKELYPDGVVSEVYKKNPLLALMPKDEEFFGDAKIVPVQYADTTGRSSTYANAKTNAGSHAGVKFVLTRKRDYAYAIIDRETMKASANNKGAIAKALDKEMKSAINKIKNSLSRNIWGKGSRSIGVIAAAGITGSTITLATVEDAVNFEKGDVVVLSGTDGGGTVRAGTALVVAGVNRKTGVITFTAGVVASIAGAVAGDFIFIDGDYDVGMSGVQAWVPTSDPSATAFFGVDRTADNERLGGIRYDGTSQPIEEALIDGAATTARYEGSPDYGFANHLDLANLAKSLGTKKEYDDIEVGGVGFRALVIASGDNEIRLLADRTCPRGKVYLLTLDSWSLDSLGVAPQIVDDDGLQIRRGTGDNFTVEIAYYAQVECNAPGQNCVVSIATS